MPLEVLAYDECATRYYGAMRVHLEKKGTAIGSMDVMIAAHAQSLGLTVVDENNAAIQCGVHRAGFLNH